MELKLPKEVQDIVNKFSTTNYQLFIVGGAVRDLLLSKEVKDWDFTTDAKPEEILKLFPEGFYDNKFGTVGIPWTVISSDSEKSADETQNKSGDSSPAEPDQNDRIIIEITTMRKEGEYQDHRHPTEVGWTDKIEEDLGRRDFTVNAIALGVILGNKVTPESDKDDSGHASLARMTLVDPFSGQQDIKDKLIRAVGDSDKRFQEDALRLIRAIRFATKLGFEIEPKTLEAIKKNAKLISEVSFERIRDELFKILASEDPYSGIVKLRESGILQIILPELEKCFGIVQEGPKHDRIYDIGKHSLLSLKHCTSNDPLVRFATLIHDVGKVDTVKVQKDGNVTFYGHDVVGGKIAEKIAERFKLSNKEKDKLIRLVRWHLFTVDENQTDSAIRRFIKNVGLENIEDMLSVRVGDRLGGGTVKAISWRMEEFQKRIEEVLKKPFSIADLKVNGQDIMDTLKIKPGPKVGDILNKLFQEVLDDSEKNNKEYLLQRTKELASTN